MIKLWCNMRFGCLPLGKPKGLAQHIRYYALRHNGMERQHRGFSAERRFADNLPAMELSDSYIA